MEGRPTQGSSRLRLFAPDGQLLKTSLESAVNLVDFPRMRTIGRISGIPIRGSGIYYFRLQLLEEGETEWQDVANIPLQVEIKSPSS